MSLSDSQEEEKEKSGEKNYYKNYRSYIQELATREKYLISELSSFRSKVSLGTPSMDDERSVKKSLEEFKDKVDELKLAYSNSKVPPGYPFKELDKRQKEIQKYSLSYEDMKKQLKKIEDMKYKYKDKIDEDYSKKEEFKNETNENLLFMQKDKLNEQDQHIDEITLDVKKNIVIAKHTNKVLVEQNKKIEDINEDIELANENMNKLTERFKNYAVKQSWCCLILIIIIELIIFIACYYILFNV